MRPLFRGVAVPETWLKYLQNLRWLDVTLSPQWEQTHANCSSVWRGAELGAPPFGTLDTHAGAERPKEALRDERSDSSSSDRAQAESG
jgi:hypothetical protein